MADRPRVSDNELAGLMAASETCGLTWAQARLVLIDLRDARTALEAARRERDDIEKAMKKQAVAYWSTPSGKRCIELGAEADRFHERAEAAEAKIAAVERERDEANERADRLAQVVANLTAEIEDAP